MIYDRIVLLFYQLAVKIIAILPMGTPSDVLLMYELNQALNEIIGLIASSYWFFPIETLVDVVYFIILLETSYIFYRVGAKAFEISTGGIVKL